MNNLNGISIFINKYCIRQQIMTVSHVQSMESVLLEKKKNYVEKTRENKLSLTRHTL